MSSGEFGACLRRDTHSMMPDVYRIFIIDSSILKVKGNQGFLRGRRGTALTGDDVWAFGKMNGACFGIRKEGRKERRKGPLPAPEMLFEGGEFVLLGF